VTEHSNKLRKLGFGLLGAVAVGGLVVSLLTGAYYAFMVYGDHSDRKIWRNLN